MRPHTPERYSERYTEFSHLRAIEVTASGTYSLDVRAAASQLQQEILKRLLDQHKVLDAMQRDFPQVSGEATVQDLVNKYVMPGGARWFVVNGANGNPGLVTLACIRNVPRSHWANTRAAQVMLPLEKLDCTRPDAMLWSALEKMGRDGVNRIPVVEGTTIVGMLSREDLVHYLRVLQAFSA